MSVIIRLQNLPWSANALDIRQFFKGLSIPEGGVHIVGGEMGDAFIAFSTDEDARQAMMNDRKKINEVQVRLLLSSRAEMQKVIETARQQSLLALQNAGAMQPKVAATPLPRTQPQPPVITTNSLQNILSNQLGAAPSFLTYQQQAGITLSDKTPDSSDSRRDSIESGRDRRRSSSRERRRSDSRERSEQRGGARRKRERSRSRERDWKNGRRPSRRSKSRERSLDRSRDRNERNRNRSSRNSKDQDPNYGNRFSKDTYNNKPNLPRLVEGNGNEKPKPSVISPWSVPPVANSYQTNQPLDSAAKKSPNQMPNNSAEANFMNPFNTIVNAALRNVITSQIGANAYSTAIEKNIANTPLATVTNAAAAILPAFQSYTTTTSTNNYSINLLANSNSASNEALKPFALQNPYTAAASLMNSNSQDSNSSSAMLSPALRQNNAMFPGIFLDKKPEVAAQQQTGLSPSNFQQEPIAFASTNPYAKMYPNLFAQAAASGTTVSKLNPPQQQQANPFNPSHAAMQGDKSRESSETCSVKVSNMCNSTTYSDLRKFFSGLFIPHNGIKMVNDKHGIRIGTAYVQFSRISSVQKALTRNNSLLKNKRIKLEIVPDEEFENAEDSFRPNNRYDRGNYGGNDHNDDDYNGDERVDNCVGNQEPFNVLYIEDIPSLATEQDIMKMFSSFTIYDILLISNPENRREFIAHVRFSRVEDAKAALEDRSRHMIGHRKVRVRAGKIEEMDKAKEKLRLANEQLMKEEQAMAEEEERKRQEEADAEEANKPDIEAEELVDDDDDVQIVTDAKSDNKYNRDPRQTSAHNNFDSDSMRPPEGRRRNADGPSDPRLRRQRSNALENNEDNANNNDHKPFMQNFKPNFNNANNSIDNNFVIMKNCEYGTRINDVADLLMSTNLQPKHIELLRNARRMPAGEFIVEFYNSLDAEAAIRDFNNTQFRMRNLRMHPIMPQEIADRLGKPFMNYFPGGGGNCNDGDFGFGDREMPRSLMDFRVGGGNMGGNNMGPRYGNNNMPMRGVRGGPYNFGGNGGGTGNNNRSGRGTRRGGVRFNNKQRNQNHDDDDGGDDVDDDAALGVNDDDSDEDKLNDVDDNVDDDDDLKDDNIDDDIECVDDVDDEEIIDNMNDNDNENNAAAVGREDSGIPAKFNQPGCVLAMENVPFKADLKDIMRFFADFDLTPDDIIRRFNDDGSPTGDARVAFKTPTIARAAFMAKKRKHIFNRTIYLHIL